MTQTPDATAALAAIGLTPRTDTDDRRTMPVSDIVFDASMIERFDLPAQRKEAADHLFGIYKSPGRNPDRNKLLWRVVGQFVSQTITERKTGGHVRQAAKISAEQKDLLAALEAMGVRSIADLQALTA